MERIVGVEIVDRAVPAWLTLLLAAACGIIVANIYYAQPLAGPIAATLGLSQGAAGLIVTMTQLGYGLGLLLIVPLGDLIENRRLIVSVMGLGGLALALAAIAPSAGWFLLAAFLLGLGSVSVQIIVPYAAHLAPDAMRGRMVGNVMSGLMLGIMLSRPVASLIAHLWSWPMVFVLSTAVMVVLGIVLRLALPARLPPLGLSYGRLLRSLVHLGLTVRILQRRALYHAFLFCAFSLFWTVTPLLLAAPPFNLSQAGIGLFALVGVGGAIAAPLAGRAADRGWIGVGTLAAMAAVAVGFLLTLVGSPGSRLSLIAFGAAAVVLDCGVTGHLVLSQRAIFAYGAEFRSRLNGLFMALFFAGGAIGSGLGAWAFAHGGWHLVVWLGLALPVLALAAVATERFDR
jgi:predicted MFS family arabinose efflux permease